jgi:peptidoglycan hydrolase-like protein with peptidoglycan-binding domain
MNRRRALVLGALGAVALVAGVAAFGVGGDRNAEPGDDASVKTVEVSRMTLDDYLDVDGVIGFGDAVPLRYLAPPAASPPLSGQTVQSGQSGPPGPSGQADEGLGLVTWLPPVGTTIERGQPLLRVDERPVVLLYGTVPLYRTLKAGSVGPDVTQLESNLQALGFSGADGRSASSRAAFTVDQQFTEATATAVRQWQRSLGLPQTGTAAPGQVLYTAGAIRVADQRIHIGDIATGDILSYTGAVPSVSATIDVSRIRGQITTGTPVTVLVGSGQSAGTVQRVGQPPDSAGAARAGPSVQVDVAVADPTLLTGKQGAATVRFVVDERKDVLVVPVLALVALVEGGYGVQVVDGSSTRYVAVGTGLFARGMVEITSGDVTVGTKVVVP